MHIQIEPLQSPTSRYHPIFVRFIYEKAFNLSVPLHHRQYMNLIRIYLISSHLTIRELVPRYNISHTVRQNYDNV